MAIGDKKPVLMQSDIGAAGGVAPAGYGLGETGGKRLDNADLDTVMENGVYLVANGCFNGPSITNIAWHTLIVMGTRGKTQIFVPSDGNGPETYNTWIARVYNDSTHTWGEWEWVNPPMIPGKEYRTTERYNGKPVYVKALNTGALPVGAGVSNRTWLYLSSENVDKIIRYSGAVTDGTTTYPLPISFTHSFKPIVSVYSVSGTFYLETDGDYSAYSGTLAVWYTKTIDQGG